LTPLPQARSNQRRKLIRMASGPKLFVLDQSQAASLPCPWGLVGEVEAAKFMNFATRPGNILGPGETKTLHPRPLGRVTCPHSTGSEKQRPRGCFIQK
jgi:hypothetical protein